MQRKQVHAGGDVYRVPAFDELDEWRAKASRVS